MNLNLKVALLAFAALTAIILPILLITQIVDRYTEDEAATNAKSFLVNGPTFRFDGIESSVQIAKAEKIARDVWIVTLSFECRHSGYGDRVGQMLLQVITPHTMDLRIDKGEIVAAIIDGVWDELRQRYL